MRTLILVLGAMFAFVAVAGVMTQLMPGPLKDSDFLVIGSVATLVGVLVLFFGLAGNMKLGGIFFKKRRKQR